MANRIPNWQREVWLTEYQVCQQDQNSEVQSYWTLTGIFVGFTSVLLGGLIYGVLSNYQLFKIILEPAPKSKELLILGIISWVLSMAVILILYFLWEWLKRVNFNSQLKFKRMRGIEFKLGMRMNFLVQAMDDWDKLKPEIEKLAKEDKKSENDLKESLKDFYITHKDQIESTYKLPSGRWHHRWIFGTLMFVWGLILGKSIYLIFLSDYCLAFGLSIGFVIVIWLVIFCLKKCLLCKRRCIRSKLETI